MKKKENWHNYYKEQKIKKDKKAKKKKSKRNIFSWKMTDEELNNQLDNYETLKITQSYRGISVLIMSALLCLSLLLGYFNIIVTLEDVLFGIILYIPILFFVYKGHRWAIISLITLITIDEIYNLYTRGGIAPIIWWLIIIPYFYKALIVENKRKKKSRSLSDKVQFCENCGNEIEEDSKFCSKCGDKIINSS